MTANVIVYSGSAPDGCESTLIKLILFYSQAKGRISCSLLQVRMLPFQFAFISLAWVEKIRFVLREGDETSHT